MVVKRVMISPRERDRWWPAARREILQSLLETYLPKQRPLRVLEAGSGPGWNFEGSRVERFFNGFLRGVFRLEKHLLRRTALPFGVSLFVLCRRKDAVAVAAARPARKAEPLRVRPRKAASRRARR